jgi:hypothetical protein
MGVGLIVTVILLGTVLGVVSRQVLSTSEQVTAANSPETVDTAYEEEPVTSHAM